MTLNLELPIFTQSYDGMQFKHPELLWALFLLLIPIFIHLFQLRRFKKTPFTNVKMLKKVISESRRSNLLKKYLLLFTRLFLLAALILAFAQPFLAKESALREKQMVIYLDDSFSLQVKTENGTLLKNGVQELLKAIPKKEKFTLFTNTKTFKQVTVQDIQNELLKLELTGEQLNLKEISLKANTFFNQDGVEKNLILISDFQQRMAVKDQDSLVSVRKHLVKLRSDNIENIAIDSLFIENLELNNIVLTALLSSNSDVKSIPISLYDGNKLIAKTSAEFNENKVANVNFTIQGDKEIKGKLEISDAALTYDNRLYFNINEKEKIKVMAINAADSDYLKKIYSDDEFDFTSYTLNDLSYSILTDQQLIVLNELKTIPNALITSLNAFLDRGGGLVVVPSIESDLASYNTLLKNQFPFSFEEKIKAEQNITNITFDHPLYQNVFEKKVTNFQYPKVAQYFKARTTLPKILSYQGGEPFLIGSKNIYVFTASIAIDNSNFKNSPLIVPTLYNMGRNSLKLPQLYQTIGTNSNVDIPYQLPKDHILKLSNQDYEFIPRQQSLANKVTLSFQENDIKAGIYSISDNGIPLKDISFNHSKSESDLVYLDLEIVNATTQSGSVKEFFRNLQDDNAVRSLWKWFVILAVLFAAMEVLILKFFK